MFKEDLSTFSAFKQLLLFETMIPAEEKPLSATVDIAGMYNISLGSFTSTIQLYLCCKVAILIANTFLLHPCYADTFFTRPNKLYGAAYLAF